MKNEILNELKGKGVFVNNYLLNDLEKKNLINDFSKIEKNKFIKFNENSDIKVHYIEPKKEKEIFPWDFTKILFSSKIKLQSDIVDHFCIDENTFKQFLSFFHKELIRLKLTFSYEDEEISNVLGEKLDYKYQLARERKSNY